MGTWGANSFENDTAADFVDELDGPDDLLSLLESVEYEQAFEANLAEKLIAAADCVAIMMGRIGPETQKAIAEKVAGFGDPSLELIDAAKFAVSRVLMGGELLDLWAETDASEFNEAITLLMDRLNPEVVVDVHKPLEPHRLKINCVFCDRPVDPDNLLELVIQIDARTISPITHCKPCHHVCLNRALNPKHLVQNWKFTEDDLALVTAHMKS